MTYHTADWRPLPDIDPTPTEPPCEDCGDVHAEDWCAWCGGCCIKHDEVVDWQGATVYAQTIEGREACALCMAGHAPDPADYEDCPECDECALLVGESDLVACTLCGWHGAKEG